MNGSVHLATSVGWRERFRLARRRAMEHRRSFAVSVVLVGLLAGTIGALTVPTVNLQSATVVAAVSPRDRVVSAIVVVAIAVSLAVLATFIWAWLRIPRDNLIATVGALRGRVRELENSERALHERMARKPLNEKHDADLRTVLPLLVAAHSLSYREMFLVADFEVHVPDSPVWRWREEYAELAPALEAAIQRFRGRLPQLVRERDVMELWQWIGVLEAILTERFRQLQEDRSTPSPPWEWAFEVDEDALGTVSLGDWRLVSREGPEVFARLKEFVSDLWTEMPTWPEVTERLELEPRVNELRTALEVHLANLQLINLAGTGPCEHC